MSFCAGGRAGPCAANGALVRRAARAKDAPRFASAAVSAMQVACAPHYPAEPRALVGSDVLALIHATGGNGRAGEVVRRIFTVTDATRFGSLRGDAASCSPWSRSLSACCGAGGASGMTNDE